MGAEEFKRPEAGVPETPEQKEALTGPEKGRVALTPYRKEVDDALDTIKQVIARAEFKDEADRAAFEAAVGQKIDALLVDLADGLEKYPDILPSEGLPGIKRIEPMKQATVAEIKAIAGDVLGGEFVYQREGGVPLIGKYIGWEAKHITGKEVREWTAAIQKGPERQDLREKIANLQAEIARAEAELETKRQTEEAQRQAEATNYGHKLLAVTTQRALNDIERNK